MWIYLTAYYFRNKSSITDVQLGSSWSKYYFNRDHLFSTYAEYFEKLIFLTAWYVRLSLIVWVAWVAYVRACIGSWVTQVRFWRGWGGWRQSIKYCRGSKKYGVGGVGQCFDVDGVGLRWSLQNFPDNTCTEVSC